MHSTGCTLLKGIVEGVLHFGVARLDENILCRLMDGMTPLL